MNRKRSERTLKTGFTTGAAAAAAAKAALLCLLTGERVELVSLTMLNGEHREIPVKQPRLLDSRTCECIVVKDAGDDPDVTHQAEIGVRVWLFAEEDRGRETEVRGQGSEVSEKRTEDRGQRTGDRCWRAEAIKVPLDRSSGTVWIFGGTGVGRVTKPGLEIAPGLPAVTEGPRTMILREIQEVFEQTGATGSVAVEIFVPQGETLAKKTMNARLGILGGISILGTTGLVHPLSHEAYQASILAGIRVAAAAGCTTLVLTTGRRSERHAQTLRPDLPEEAFLQMGDFFEFAVKSAGEQGITNLVLAMFWGKAVKMAQGFPHTHAAKSALSLHKLGEWAAALSRDARLVQAIQSANTARQTFAMIQERLPELISEVGRRIQENAWRFGKNSLEIRVVILDFEGKPVFQG
jgi:cobalt-precorrin-5B (C1)-methyltransferase